MWAIKMGWKEGDRKGKGEEGSYLVIPLLLPFPLSPFPFDLHSELVSPPNPPLFCRGVCVCVRYEYSALQWNTSLGLHI